MFFEKILRQCCKLDFFQKKPFRKIKCQMDTFYEVLPGNSVFSKFYYIGTKKIRYLNHTIEFSIKNYTSMEILSIGIQILCKTSRDQPVQVCSWLEIKNDANLKYMEKSANIEISHLLASRKKNWSDRNNIYQYMLLFAYP